MSRFTYITVSRLVVLAGCQAASSSACPAIRLDDETVDTPVCPDEQASGLSLSLDEKTETVSITVENVGNEAVLVTPDRWTAFQKVDSEQHTSTQKWRVAANAPAGTYNSTTLELAPAETKTWTLMYKPNATDPQSHHDRVLAKSGQYAFSLGADNRTYTGFLSRNMILIHSHTCHSNGGERSITKRA
jgi:hypothetical protein